MDNQFVVHPINRLSLNVEKKERHGIHTQNLFAYFQIKEVYWIRIFKMVNHMYDVICDTMNFPKCRNYSKKSKSVYAN
jgi:hypothetical protein